MFLNQHFNQHLTFIQLSVQSWVVARFVVFCSLVWFWNILKPTLCAVCQSAKFFHQFVELKHEVFTQKKYWNPPGKYGVKGLLGHFEPAKNHQIHFIWRNNRRGFKLEETGIWFAKNGKQNQQKESDQFSWQASRHLPVLFDCIVWENIWPREW